MTRKKQLPKSLIYQNDFTKAMANSGIEVDESTIATSFDLNWKKSSKCDPRSDPYVETSGIINCQSYQTRDVPPPWQ